MRRIAIAVVAGDDLLLFGSSEAAERHIEPVDIRAGVHPAAFDRDGRPHRLRIDDDGWGIETVRLVPVAGEAPRPQELRRRLADRLAAAGVSVRADASLADLLRRAEWLCTR